MWGGASRFALFVAIVRVLRLMALHAFAKPPGWIRLQSHGASDPIAEMMGAKRQQVPLLDRAARSPQNRGFCGRVARDFHWIGARPERLWEGYFIA